MHSAFYKEYLKSPLWQSRRRAKLELAQFRCEACGEKESLEVHHLTYERLGHEDSRDLVVLCTSCHWFADKIRKNPKHKFKKGSKFFSGQKSGKFSKKMAKERKQSQQEYERFKKSGRELEKLQAARLRLMDLIAGKPDSPKRPAWEQGVATFDKKIAAIEEFVKNYKSP